MKKPSIDELRSFYGGFWRYNILDFHFLFNHYFPTPEFYDELAKKLPIIGNYYPSSQKVLAELLSKWKDEKYFSADNLIVGNGSSELIRLLIDHVFTRVTVPFPTFNEYAKMPNDKIHKFLLTEEEKFTLDVDRLIEEAKKSNSEFIIIVNPNNPVWNLVSLKDIEKILNTGITLVVDEAFMAFAGEENSAEKLISEYNNLVVITSCTKSIGIAGLRLGYLLTTNEDIKSKIRKHLPIWNINSITEYVIEIFPKFKEEHGRSIEKIKLDTGWFFEKLKMISYLDPFPSYADAILCKLKSGSARRLVEILYEKYDLLTKDGLNQSDFHTDSYIRFGVRNRGDNQKLLDALHEIKVEDIVIQ